jgi:hypothetical protein
LFLTTNRVGALDEAVKSRITWISYYPPLNWKQTREIWKANIKRVKKANKNLDVDENGIIKYAKNHYNESLTQGTVWNGRRIQNAFKVAIALAHWEAYSKEERDQLEQAISVADDDNCHHHSALSANHFRIYAAETKAFDIYTQSATGFNDAERAYNAMERDDNFPPDDITPLMSPVPGYDGGQSYFVPHDERRTSTTTSLIAPHSIVRSSSPNVRPGLGPRNSSSNIPSHQRTQQHVRTGIVAAPSQSPTHSRRRSSQLTSPSQLLPPTSTIRRRPSAERRGLELDMRQSHDEREDAGITSDDSDEDDEQDTDSGSGSQEQ